MFHYVHQLVANCASLLFCAEQVVSSWFYKLFILKQLPSAATLKDMRVVKVNHNI